MAVVGDILLTPEAGWKRYDDSSSDFQYFETWQTESNSSFYLGYAKQSNIQNAEVKFGFYGTKLRVIAYKTSACTSNVQINIDGVNYSFSLFSSSVILSALVFEKTDLENTVHEVTIIKTDATNNNLWITFDAIDIDDTGRLTYSLGKEVTNLDDIQIGDVISCEYTASSGNFGTFGNLGSATKDLIPIASSATPDGKFYFIHTGYDHLGRMKLVADRNIQHNISWDKLNEVGIAGTENIISIDNKDFRMRLLSGGVSATDKDNEWDKIIAEYDLDGTIIAGTSLLWNWNGVGSWTSSTPTTGNTYRAVRGNSSVIARIDNQASSVVSATIGFRPVLLKEIEGLAFEDANRDYYTTPNGIKIRPLDVGNLVGGRQSNVFGFEVSNTYATDNFNIELKALRNSILAEDKGNYGLLYDAVDERHRTEVTFSLDGVVYTPDYPLTTYLGAGQKKTVYMKLKPSTLTNGQETIQILMTGRIV